MAPQREQQLPGASRRCWNESPTTRSHAPVSADGAGPRPLRTALDGVGFTPLASKLRRPAPGSVPRPSLVERVRAARGELVTVTAPAGYGKSTFVAALTDADPRPTAWVSLGPTDGDLASFLTYVAVALDAIEPVAPRHVVGLWQRPVTLGSSAVQRFGAMVGARREPFTLVLDDVHEVPGPTLRAAMAVVVDELPPGSTLVLCSRTVMPLQLTHVRHRRLVEINLRDLALDAGDAARLFDGLGVPLTAEQINRVVELTEGWPAAMHLAALTCADVLRTQRWDPTHRAAVHPAASRWCDEHGECDDAVAQPAHADDIDGAEAMFERWCRSTGPRGRPVGARRWTTTSPPDEQRTPDRLARPSLTSAELRVLEFLPTHLTIREIARRLYVSPNTVKTQTISIYRKFGTTSRSGAVELAAAVGLLD